MLKQTLHPSRTTWHITFGTYGTRLHGGDLPTVERNANLPGQPFLTMDHHRKEWIQGSMRDQPIRLTDEQRVFIEETLPRICEPGHWTYRIGAAPPPPDNTHVHLLCDADPSIHGKQIRQWLKRWLTEAMNHRWKRSSRTPWWAEAGSTKPVKNDQYLNHAFEYIRRQRTIPFIECG